MRDLQKAFPKMQFIATTHSLFILQSLEPGEVIDLNYDALPTAFAKGFWSIWMTVFKDDPDMLRRFINKFKGTCSQCFDKDNHYAPVVRPGGQI